MTRAFIRIELGTFESNRIRTYRNESKVERALYAERRHALLTATKIATQTSRALCQPTRI